jgi:hypothetical protein
MMVTSENLSSGLAKIRLAPKGFRTAPAAPTNVAVKP